MKLSIYDIYGTGMVSSLAFLYDLTTTVHGDHAQSGSFGYIASYPNEFGLYEIVASKTQDNSKKTVFEDMKMIQTILRQPQNAGNYHSGNIHSVAGIDK